jgi:integrase
MLLQSGIRIGELIEINISDVDFSFKPTKIRIRAEITKTRNQRYCFIGMEATDSLKAWLNHRETFLNLSLSRAIPLQEYYHRERNSRDANDDRIFPFSISLVRGIWNRLLDDAELSERDQRTKVRKMHPHVLRKYFMTHMSLTVPIDVVEALMGHEGYLTEAYRRYTIEQLGEEYLKGEKDISVFETPANLNGINESLKEKDAEIADLKEKAKLQEMRLDIMALKLESMEKGKKKD